MPGIPTLNEAFAKFLPSPRRKHHTRRKYKYRLAPFLERYGHLPVNHIDDETILDWFTNLEKRYAEATLSIYRSCFYTFFSYCQEHEWLHPNPIRHIRRYSQLPIVIKTANEENLAQALTYCGILSKSDNPYHRRNAAIFALGAISGARRSNIMHMPYRETIQALNNPLHESAIGEFYAVPTGGKERGEVVFGSWHATLLRRYLEIRPPTNHNKLFIQLEPHSKTFTEPLGEIGMDRARRTICRIANIPNITFQEMRRLKGTKVARRYGLELAAQVLGHKSGTRVIREHYYDPDRQSARIAVLETDGIYSSRYIART